MTPLPTSQLIARVVLVAAVTLLAIWMLWRFLPALAWAAVLAIATWPLREQLVRGGSRPAMAAILLTILLALALIVPLVVLGIQIAREAFFVVDWVRSLRESGLATPGWIGEVPFVGGFATAWWESHLASPEAAKELLGRAESVGIVHWTQFGTQLANRLAILGFTLLTLFFLYRDGPQLLDDTKVIGGELFGPQAKRIGRDAINTVRGTVNGLVLVGLAEGVILGFAYVAAGLGHPVLFGFATGVLATVPFGAPVVYTVAALTLAAEAKVTAGILVFAFGSLVVFVADHFVRPTLISGSTRLPFLWVLLGIFGGLETFGLVGLFLGPAIISIGLAIWRDAASLSACEPDATQ